MSIVPANQIGCKHSRADIIECFCDNLMQHIQKAASEGRNSYVFNATVYYHKETGEIYSKLPQGHKYQEWDFYKYSFSDYEDEIREKFRKAGYTIKPTGYIGGVWQRSETIFW